MYKKEEKGGKNLIKVIDLQNGKDKKVKYIKEKSEEPEDTQEIEDDDDDKENEEDQNELKAYSEKRSERLYKRKRRKRRVIVLLLLAVAAFFIYANWQSLAPSAVADNIKSIMADFGQSKYPVEIEDGTLSAAVPVGSNIGILTDTSFIVYSKNGDKLDTRPHGINNPTAVYGGGKALIYDRGGKSFKVESRYSEEYSSNADFNITSAAMGGNGSFAVVTEAENYLSEAKVYSNSYKMIFKWDCVQGRILASALSSNGKTYAAVVVGVRNGNMFSDIYIYNTASTVPVAVKKYDDTLLYSINFTDSTHISAVGDKKAVFVDTSGKEISVFDYGDKELADSANTGDTPVLAFKKGTSQTELYSFGAGGNKKGTTVINAANIKSLNNGSGKTVLLSGDTLWYFNSDCSNGSHITIKGNTKSVFSLNNSAYIFKTQSVERQSIK